MSRHLLITLAIAATAGIVTAPIELGGRLFRRFRRRAEVPARIPA